MTQEKIQQMQFLEQNLQAILMQKQAIQMEVSETTSAIKELEDSQEDVYKIIGQLMIKTKKEKILQELQKKEKLLTTRLENLDKQEEQLTEQTNKIREELLENQTDKK